jgi:hypothetical protein
MEASTEHADMLAEFIGITDAEAAIAEAYLESCSFNLERALDMFFRGEDLPPATAAGGCCRL